MADAKDMIQQVLQFYGLESLTDWAWGQIVDGASPEQVLQSLRQQPQYEQRFPGLNAMRGSGRAVSEEEWTAYEKQAVGLLRAAGLPATFYDQPQDIASFITNEVSVNELQQRVQAAQTAAYNEFDTQAAAVYGLAPGDLTALLLDATRAEPIVMQKFHAVQAAKIADQTGYGQLNAAEAERIALTGVDPSQQVGQFGSLATQREVFTPINTGEQTITREEQLAATFEGNADAQAKIKAQAQRRVNEFAAGGSFSQGQRGFVGVQ